CRLQLSNPLKGSKRHFESAEERVVGDVQRLKERLARAIHRCRVRIGEFRWRATARPVARRTESVRWGNMRRLAPFSRKFAIDRGQCIDRWYIESFLKTHCADIKGRILEIAGCEYTKKFGGDRVFQSDVLHAVPGNSHATLVGDLQTGAGIPASAFDCMILTQTL